MGLAISIPVTGQACLGTWLQRGAVEAVPSMELGTSSVTQRPLEDNSGLTEKRLFPSHWQNVPLGGSGIG